MNGRVGLLGRFGVFGIDIHREISEQNAKGECLFCTQGKTTSEDWDTFVAKMQELYGIRVPQKYKPKGLKHEQSIATNATSRDGKLSAGMQP